MMRYIKCEEGDKRKYLSIFGRWVSPLKKSVRFNAVKPMPLQWKDELQKFPTQKESENFIKIHKCKKARAVNGIK